MPDLNTQDDDVKRKQWLADLYSSPPPSPADAGKMPRQRAEDFPRAPSDLDSALTTGRAGVADTIERATPDVVKEALPKGIKVGERVVDSLGERLKSMVTDRDKEKTDKGTVRELGGSWDL